MAITEAALLSRLIAVCIAQGYTQAVAGDFTKQPDGNIDGVFIARLQTGATRGGMSFTEEGRAVLVLEVSRPVNDDFDAADLVCLGDVRTLKNAIVRDGAEVSGEYAVDDGFSATVEHPPGAHYLVSRSRIPLNYEATL